jgi:hypothetical protein
VNDKTIRTLVRTIAAGELPVPPWSRVQMRATFEDRLAPRRAPLRLLVWIEMAIYVGVGIAIAAVATWAIFVLQAALGS